MTADLRLVLAALAVAVAYALFVLASPAHACPRCHGKTRVIRGNRVRPCPAWRCKNGRQFRPGAVAVHRFFWSVLGDRLMSGRREVRKASRQQEGSK